MSYDVRIFFVAKFVAGSRFAVQRIKATVLPQTRKGHYRISNLGSLRARNKSNLRTRRDRLKYTIRHSVHLLVVIETERGGGDTTEFLGNRFSRPIEQSLLAEGVHSRNQLNFFDANAHH